VTVEVQDLDKVAKQHSRNSRGYFLVVGDVKKAAAEKPKVTPQKQHKVSVTMAGLSPTPNTEAPKKQRTSR
jgi:hypothetical protein